MLSKIARGTPAAFRTRRVPSGDSVTKTPRQSPYEMECAEQRVGRCELVKYNAKLANRFVSVVSGGTLSEFPHVLAGSGAIRSVPRAGENEPLGGGRGTGPDRPGKWENDDGKLCRFIEGLARAERWKAPSQEPVYSQFESIPVPAGIGSACRRSDSPSGTTRSRSERGEDATSHPRRTHHHRTITSPQTRPAAGRQNVHPSLPSPFRHTPPLHAPILATLVRSHRSGWTGIRRPHAPIRSCFSGPPTIRGN